MNSKVLEEAAIVVAHPDDELLWFGSILPMVSKVIICFTISPAHQEISKGRLALAERMKSEGTIFLGINEADVFDSADWNAAELSPYGLNLLTEEKHRSYKDNFHAITDALRPLLAGKKYLFTHNPWGEYGHEEHVQVFRAVQLLQAEMGFSLYFSSYLSARSLPMFLKQRMLISLPELRFSVDPEFVRTKMNLYIEYGCWTWKAGYEWPVEEAFLKFAGDFERREPCCDTVPLIFIRDVEARQRAGSCSIDRALSAGKSLLGRIFN